MIAGTAAALSVVIPTHDNEDVLGECLRRWQTFGPEDLIELIVVEDGCRDATPRLLDRVARTTWGARHLRWIHTDDVHELKCTNAGLAAARAPLALAWQDDMYLSARWLVPEILRAFEACPDIGLMSLSRGLNHHPADGAIDSWDALNDWSRLRSTIGPFGWNWFRIQEVDTVIRPWVVRRDCLTRVGPLDDAYVPTEWDEADLAFRIRSAGWKVATCGYERLGGYDHLGSSTLGALSDAYRTRVLENGRRFHERWDTVIARDHRRERKTWPRPRSVSGMVRTCGAIVARAVSRSTGAFR